MKTNYSNVLEHILKFQNYNWNFVCTGALFPRAPHQFGRGRGPEHAVPLPLPAATPPHLCHTRAALGHAHCTAAAASRALRHVGR